MIRVCHSRANVGSIGAALKSIAAPSMSTHYGTAGIHLPVRPYRFEPEVSNALDGLLSDYSGTYAIDRYGLRIILELRASDVPDALDQVVTIAIRVAETIGLSEQACFDVGASVLPFSERIRPPVSHPVPNLLGAAEVAEYLGVSRRGLYELVKRGDFPQPTFQLKATRVWTEKQIHDYVELQNRVIPFPAR